MTQRGFTKKMETDFAQMCPVKVQEAIDTGCRVAAREIIRRPIN